MPDLNERDPIELQRTLAEWLATKLGPGAAPEVTEVLAPASNGFSNETVLCRAKWDDGSGSEEHRLVFRSTRRSTSCSSTPTSTSSTR